MFDTSLFRQSIVDTIKCWPSFQLSLNSGMGGPDSADKVNWMCDWIVKLFADNQNIFQDDLSELLAQILNNEFDTIIEDGSLEMICSSICAYYNNILSGNVEFVMNKINILKQKHANLEIEQRNPIFDDLTIVSPYVGQMNPVVQNDVEMSNKGDNDDQDGDGGGWTVVKRKK